MIDIKQFVLPCLMAVIPFVVRAEETTKIAVMDIAAKQGVSPQVTASLTDVITAEIAKIPGYDVINRDDMRAMLEHVAQQQALGCDDTKCLVEIGGALGVEQLLSGNIGKVGNAYVINIKVIDIDNASVVSRISEEFIGSETKLVARVRASVNKLMVSDAYRRTVLLRRIGIGVTAVSAAAGAYFAYRGYDIYENEFLTAVGHDNTIRARDDYERMDLLRNIFLGVTGASAGVTLYWYF